MTLITSVNPETSESSETSKPSRNSKVYLEHKFLGKAKRPPRPSFTDLVFVTDAYLEDKEWIWTDGGQNTCVTWEMCEFDRSAIWASRATSLAAIIGLVFMLVYGFGGGEMLWGN